MRFLVQTMSPLASFVIGDQEQSQQIGQFCQRSEITPVFKAALSGMRLPDCLGGG
jgi:hypothetical protein